MKKYIKDIQNGKKIDAEGMIEKARNIDDKHHYFAKMSPQLAIQLANASMENKPLAGVAVTLKDAICVKGVESRAGSAILNGYVPVYNSTVAQKIIDAGGIIIGKTIQDEFGFGSFSVNVAHGFKIPTNPNDESRATGGSSGGAAGLAKAANFPHIAIGESTGGSIVCPAALCGVIGLCPTYGLVSRYGLMDYASSMDKIGPITKTVQEAAMMLQVISGYDEKDSTSYPSKTIDYEEALTRPFEGTVGVIMDLPELEPEVKKAYEKGIEYLKKFGVKVKEIDLPLTKEISLEAYYILAMCEASTNLSKLCGLRYGETGDMSEHYDDYFSKIRGKFFTQEAKRRIIIGTFARMTGFRDAYYLKAAKIRRKIIDEYKLTFEDVDVIMCPTIAILAPKFEDIEKLTPMQHYAMDILTAGPNLAGLPHISVPISAGKLPAGIMFIGDHFEESKILQTAKIIEDHENRT